MISNRTFKVRPARNGDLDAVVTSHLAAFPGFFLTFLGRRFIKAFYSGLIDAPHGILLVATDARDIAGFVGGATDQGMFFQWLLTNRRKTFVKEAAIAAARHPSSVGRLWRARRRASHAESSSANAALLTLGVDSRFRRQGIGERLVASFDQTMLEQGIDEYCLTTDTLDNAAANNFYLSLGMKAIATHSTPEGRQMTEYMRHILG